MFVLILKWPQVHETLWGIFHYFSLSPFPIRQNDSAAKAGLLLTDVSHAVACNGSQGQNMGCHVVGFWIKGSIFISREQMVPWVLILKLLVDERNFFHQWGTHKFTLW